jgi:uncharacterized peroxidase-related enzyme
VTRLPSINHAWRLSDRMKLRLIRLASGREPADIIKLLFYRSDYFGTAFGNWVNAVLRGPSTWTVGERELIAAFVSSLNKCRFCSASHGAVASIEMGADLTTAVTRDWRTAPVSDAMRAALGFAEAITLRPDSVGADDVAPMRAAGLPVEAITDVVHICAIFGTINRIADAVDFAVPDEAGQLAAAKSLLKRGYALG